MANIIILIHTLWNFVSFYYNLIINVIVFVYVCNVAFRTWKKLLLKDKIVSKNKAVLITGCSRGFGHELAKRMDSLGFNVFAGCRSLSCPGAYELKSKCSERLTLVELDVSKQDSVTESVIFVKKNLGASELWAIVNNAGIAAIGTSEGMSIETAKENMDVNAFGAIRVTQAFLPLLRHSKGRIVNVNSRAGRVAVPFLTPYTMSKWALLAFTDCLRHEIDVWGIKVISIEPEIFKTDMVDFTFTGKQTDDFLQSIDKSVKDEYGYNYLKNIKNLPKIWGNISSPNIEAVTSSLEAAICLKYPNDVYQPCRNVFVSILLYFAEVKFIYTFCTKVGLYYFGLRTIPRTKKQM